MEVFQKIPYFLTGKMMKFESRSEKVGPFGVAPFSQGLEEEHSQAQPSKLGNGQDASPWFVECHGIWCLLSYVFLEVVCLGQSKTSESAANLHNAWGDHASRNLWTGADCANPFWCLANVNHLARPDQNGSKPSAAGVQDASASDVTCKVVTLCWHRLLWRN